MKSEFTITVAVCPEGTDLSRELRYIKSALLYADAVQIISLGAYLYSEMTNEGNFANERSSLKLFQKALPYCIMAHPECGDGRYNAFFELEELLKSNKYKNAPLPMKFRLKTELRMHANEMADAIRSLVGTDNSVEIDKLLKTGKLKIHKFSNGAYDTDKSVEEFFHKLQEVATEGCPLFDEQANGLIEAALRENIIQLSDVAKIKATHTGVTDFMLSRLPSFDAAPIDEILDIRKELNDPLIRFRGKVIQYSKDIQSLPWDKDFIDECDLHFRQNIAPAILEINERTAENNFLKNLGQSIVTDVSSLKNLGGLLIGVAATGAIKTYAQAMSADALAWVAGGSVAAAKIAGAYKEYVAEKRNIAKNDIYFYYQAGKKISRY